MMGITELAPAKLNLTLDVGARRPDGYHDITSVMQSAALYDVVALDFVRSTRYCDRMSGHGSAHRPRQPGLESGGCLFPGDKYPLHRDYLSDWRKKSPPRPVLAAAAATQPPCCGECVVYFSIRCVRRIVRSHGRPGGQRCSLLHPGRYGSGPGPGRTAYRSSGTAYVLVRYREAPGGQLYRRDVSGSWTKFPSAGPPGFR